MVVTQNAKITPLLAACNVCFGYDARVPLLFDLSLSVYDSEMVGLLGPNGSGKTTLLRLFSGILRPQQGEIVLENCTLSAWRRVDIARRIAVVPQELHIPYAFTVEQMVSMGRAPFIRSFFGARRHRDNEVVHEAMQAANVTALAKRVFQELSGGERQRVMIAMALAQEPRILLLDEPTAHLDIKYQIETLDLVRQLNQEQGVAVIAALHDLNLAARYFSRLVLFQRGVVADGGPTEVLEPDLLSRVYGVDVQVGILRGSEHISVLPPGSREKGTEQSDHTAQPLVHVIAGGGSGEMMMRALADEHIPFVAGALNIGDSDHTLALRLAESVITEQPYAPVSPPALEQMRASLAQVRTLIVCPVAIGPGNLVLLQEAVQAVQRGLQVILLSAADDNKNADLHESPLEARGESTGMAMRDYTGGQAVELERQLLQAGAVVKNTVSAALETVIDAIKSASDVK
jgi:iron complex transport system ATP-binding protein